MSAVLGSYTYEMDASYAADFGRDREPMKKRSRHPEYRRKGLAPTRVNGMHCRRNKRWSWGSGRGARMANLRAFASCAAVIAAVAASSAVAAPVDFTWSTIGNAGNAAYTGNSAFRSGVGSVSYDYRMSQYETTRGQYAAFLNSVASSTSAPSYVQGLWNSGMGITRSLSGGAYTYVASGSTSPISNVTWTNAARFVNWLNNSQPTVNTGTGAWNTALNQGAYTLTASDTSSTVTARNAGMTTAGAQPKYFLPSASEWIKAGFYDPTNTRWNTWQTGVSGTAMPASTKTPTTNANTAVFNTGTSSPGYAALPVGSVPNTKSPYGLYDMLGNVTEMTDTAGAGNAWYAVSGGFATTTTNMTSSPWNINNTRFLTAMSSANGFRVAGVAAVPEPETITLAAFGIVGLCGANWMRRRRKGGGSATARMGAVAA